MATMWCRNEIVRWTLQRIAFFQSKGGWSIRFTHKTSRVFLDVCIPGNSIWPFFWASSETLSKVNWPPTENQNVTLNHLVYSVTYISLHTSDWLWHIGGSIFSSPTKPHLSLPFLASAGKESFPNKLPDNFFWWNKQLMIHDPIHSPPKKKKTDVLQKVFSWTFWELLYIIIYILFLEKSNSLSLKLFSRCVFHAGPSLRGVRWVIPEILIGKFPRIQPCRGWLLGLVGGVRLIDW